MILSFINIRKVPQEVLKTLVEVRGFQHFPRDLVNVNEWKIMFDPSINSYLSKVTFPYLPLFPRVIDIYAWANCSPRSECSLIRSVFFGIQLHVLEAFLYSEANFRVITAILWVSENLGLLHLSLVMRKPFFYICKNRDADTAQLISAFVFATQIVQSLYFLNPKLQAPSHLL